MQMMGKSARMAALILLAMAAALSNSASADWTDDPDTPDAADTMMAQPAALELSLAIRKRAQIPRQLACRAPLPEVNDTAAASLGNSYSLSKQTRGRAPPPLVQLK